MPAKNEKAKVQHYPEACFKVLTPTNEPVANIIDGNVQLNVLSYITDNFQGVAEMVIDHLPKARRVDFVKKTQLNSLGANNVDHRKYF